MRTTALALVLLVSLLARAAAAQDVPTLTLAYDTASPPIRIVESDYSTSHQITPRVIACWTSTPNDDRAVAVRVIYPDAPSVWAPTVTLDHVIVLPGCWRGFWGTNVWNARLTHFMFLGNFNAFPEAAIVLDGRSNDVTVDEAHVFYADVGIWMADRTEGLHVTNSAIIGVDRGVYVNTENGRPGLWLRDSHIAAYSRGVSLFNHPQNIIGGNIIYRSQRLDGSLNPNYVGIEVGPGANDTSLSQNIVMCSKVQASTRAVTVAAGVGRFSAFQPPPIGCGGNITRPVATVLR